MNFLKRFCFKALKYDLNNKFLYKSTKELPKFKKIVLNFGCQANNLKQLSASLLAIELIAGQKGTLTKTKYSNVLLGIRKGTPTGCKMIIQKSKMFNILNKLLIKVFVNEKNFNGFTLSKTKAFSFQIHNIFSFYQLKKHYYLFNDLPKLQITVLVDSQTKKELIFFLSSLNFFFKQ
jgi:large subunit ribosomal protein L5